MLRYAFLMAAIFASGTLANAIAGKWQLLFFYETYRYQVDAFGWENTEMAYNCVKDGGVCDLESFARAVSTVGPVTEVGDDGVKRKVRRPTYNKVDWEKIGDGDTFDQDKFNSEMDKADFRGGVNNDALFYYWDGRKGSFESVMSEAERIIKQAQAKLTSDGLPISNGRYKALQNALKIHLNARRLDQATKLLKTFEIWALEKGYKVVLGDEISRPLVPPYKQVDAEAIVKGKGLEGAEADELRNWVK